MKITIVKIVTLALFASLLTIFIAFRSGYIKHPATPVALTKEGQTIPGDTIDSLRRFNILPSSKSLILLDHVVPQRDSSLLIVLDPDSLKK